MSTRPHARASSTLRLGVSAALMLASLTPTPARAEQPAVPKEAEDHYDRGVREREAGRHAVAAQEFAAAYEGMPPGLKELRASILFDLVDAHRSAFAAGGRVRGREHPAAHLCAAEAALGEFRGAAEQSRKPRAKKSTDELKADELLTAVKSDLAAARSDTPDLDCATVEYPKGGPDEPPQTTPDPATDKPAARPKPIMPLVIAGSVTAAVGLAMFGLMTVGLIRGNRADADGNALVDLYPTRDKLDADLQEIDRRGRVGNRMAIAGGVLGGLCLGTGVALLVFGLRGKPGSRVAAAPYATPQSAGFTVRLQF
jgi:hypothetical protein